MLVSLLVFLSNHETKRIPGYPQRKTNTYTRNVGRLGPSRQPRWPDRFRWQRPPRPRIDRISMVYLGVSLFDGTRDTQIKAKRILSLMVLFGCVASRTTTLFFPWYSPFLVLEGKPTETPNSILGLPLKSNSDGLLLLLKWY